MAENSVVTDVNPSADVTVHRRRVVVIGAGQAGLSAAYFLKRAGLRPGVDLEVLDANPTAGGAWSHRWDALTFDHVNGLHDLPDSRLGAADPAEPARDVVTRYYGRYEQEKGLGVQRPWRVRSVRAVDDPGARFRVVAERPDGALREYAAGAVVSATGTWDQPYVPWYRGRFGGRQLTTRDFTAPGDFAGRRVLVVGGGISAIQFVQLLDEHGVDTLWSTRTPPRWRDCPFDTEAGLGVENRVAARTRAGLRPRSVVAETGLPTSPSVLDAIDRGVLVSRGPIRALTSDGVDFADGTHEAVDVILWATGFRASLSHLAPLGIRERTGGVVMADDDVSVVKAPGVSLVGYGRSASTLGATRAGRRAARRAVDFTADLG
ncbi:NAD(P)/FAD-dependent oxidoreductase [Gordonia sp. HY285]|uniref:NAD(P)/FAD-dependent oxidoreductase n=1 Tax=Gordonia liuliyuniae TaxID=2911517 RepID=A0ABS9IV00_9ACTN|nr:NAD(P)/FAD-dependent oxidoreductase [Gordonia liuliyuniae]MCF8589394.1 NAD(P)/FAD-dependent oxidoreductase [Gordonia liuliyuniae]MCF8611357.1 NAD(P)/FAD-dependent oxidoreductase [Gordonia liuliyuniae]